ncbi:MAG: hypothetical protein CVV57_09285 [Tenericutes bacterium HGW-Tenericutes-2]|jgi:GNAT superfamily N-acetyltransferase|nr:MAG: hypothetical protein CVV57_09285 [Tenericutes bacterium HGW-Tenericutes-2]
MIDTDTFRYERLLWDTDYFGFNCGKILVLNEINSLVLSDIDAKCDLNKFTSIHMSTNAKNIFLISKLKNSFLADMPCKLVKKIDSHKLYKFENVQRFNSTVHHDLDKNLSKLITISGNAFTEGRFYRDLNISNEQASNLYEKWLLNSIKENNNIIYHDRYEGFLVYTYNDSNINIDLIAVDEKSRGKGIGKNLLNCLFYTAQKESIESITVYTQSHNYKAINFYCNSEFRISDVSSVFHVWRDK